MKKKHKRGKVAVTTETVRSLSEKKMETVAGAGYTMPTLNADTARCANCAASWQVG